MKILGVSAFYHDSAAALVEDGRIVAAVQEERFTRKKHDMSFPACALAYCLEEARSTVSEVDYVVFYEKPLLKFERLLETYLAFAPAGFRSFRHALPLWLRQKLFLRREIRRGLGRSYQGPLIFTEHHESHAASAFFPSPFEMAAIVTVDGVGEWATTTVGEGYANRIRVRAQINFPHSLGLLYSAFTYYTGFKVNSGEYKLMGLAPYGEPRYADVIREKLIDIKPDGSFRLNQDYFNYCQGLTMTSRRFERLFGRKPRRPESRLEEFHMDLAASVQTVTEEVMLKIAAHAHEITGLSQLCLAGGVALNCVANGRILRESPFEHIWIQPAAGDAGGALGAALFVWYQLLEKERTPQRPDAQHASYLGPAFGEKACRLFLNANNAVYRDIANDETLAAEIADQIADGKVVGLFRGRMEFGPRALGARSILGDARSPKMQKVMNLKVKFRESFRPFAPSVMREKVDQYFQMSPNADSPYMLLVADVQQDKRTNCATELHAARGLSKLPIVRSELPATTHVDFSARIQTVDPARHPFYYSVLKHFYDRTGVPVIINTSFNVRGEPIVCTPQDAYNCFMATNMDTLVMDRFILQKVEQPDASEIKAEDHLSQFAPD